MPPRILAPVVARLVRGALLALSSALLFAFVGVAAKTSALPAVVEAAAAYLLAGLLLSPALRGTRFDRADVLRVVTVALFGGLLAPLALFYGLEHTTAVDASLLLTLEMGITAALASVFLHERLRLPSYLGVGLLLAAALAVAWAGDRSGAGASTALGVALVALAALGWSIDNLASASLSLRYKPTALVAIKGLLGGTGGLLVALVLGLRPDVVARDALLVLFIGLLGVGVSTVLFYAALRDIGATRTASIFVPGAAILGALAGWALRGEALTSLHGAAAALATAGVLLLLRRAA